MRRRTKYLKQAALESVSLAVELFNRPSPLARVTGTLMHLQHAFEMLLKAAIYERRGTITPKGESRAHSLNTCLRILHSHYNLITEEEVRTIAIVDSHRDAAQHSILILSESALYIDVQAGVTVFAVLLNRFFQEELAANEAFSGRVLPVSTVPPREFGLIAQDDLAAVRELLTGHRRQRTAAAARLLPYVLTERAVANPFEVEQPSEKEVLRAASELISRPWDDVLPGVAQLSLESEGSGTTYCVRIVKGKNETALPVQLVQPEATGDASTAIGLVPTDLLKRFPFLVSELADQSGLSSYDAQAAVYYLEMKFDGRFHQRIPRGRRTSDTYEDRYSHAALAKLRQEKDQEGFIIRARAAYRQRPKDSGGITSAQANDRRS